MLIHSPSHYCASIAFALFEFEDVTHLFAIRISVHNDGRCRCSNTRSNDHTHDSEQGHIP